MVIWYVILPKSDPEYLCPAAVILQGPCFLAQVPWERTWCPMAIASPVSTGLKSSKSVPKSRSCSLCMSVHWQVSCCNKNCQAPHRRSNLMQGQSRSKAGCGVLKEKSKLFQGTACFLERKQEGAYLQKSIHSSQWKNGPPGGDLSPPPSSASSQQQALKLLSMSVLALSRHSSFL